MTMCISILLALVVFLLLVSKILPPTSMNIPLIAKYLLFTFIMNIITILITVIIINWNFRTPRTHPMSPWVQTIFLKVLPRILWMTRPSYDDRWAKKAYNQRLRRSAIPDISRSRATSNPVVAEGSASIPGRGGGRVSESVGKGSESGFRLTPDRQKAIEAVKFIAAHLKNEDDYAEVGEEQRF